MAKVSTNISLDADLKKASQELYADLGMDLTTAVTIFFNNPSGNRVSPLK